jgi:small subunit ribosomal protein S1
LSEEKIEGWLTETYDYQRPKRGQVREGIILKVEDQGLFVDVGLKRDGFIPDSDIERLDEEIVSELEPGQEVEARIVRTADREGNIVLSLYQARLKKDWDRAHEMLESGDVAQGEVVEFNKGGLITKFGRLRGFVPGSHLWAPARRRFSRNERKELFQEYVGEELPLKVIEVNRDKRRLILSERLARRQMRKQQRKQLLNELMEGQVVEGTVRHLTDFGAFVDVGGADGLVHVSELAWRHIQHPSEVLEVGDKVKVYVLNLDRKRERIGLSLKRLQPNPWDAVELTYNEGQLVLGTVSDIKDFGAFVTLDVGVDGLVHISELADPPPKDPRTVVQPGDEVVLRILHIDSFRHQIGLSLRRVSAEERAERLMQNNRDQETAPDEIDSTASTSTHTSDNGKTSPGETDGVEEMIFGGSEPERVAQEGSVENLGV